LSSGIKQAGGSIRGPAVELAALAGMSRADLIDLWTRYFRSAPPLRIGRRILALGVGWAIQAELQGGGLSRAAEQRLRRRLRQPSQNDDGAHRPPKLGTRFVREWHGEVHVVEATVQGFVWRDQTYASLTAIAREITGAKWSGPRFFGLPGRTDQ
jgi:hypothetical protein